MIKKLIITSLLLLSPILVNAQEYWVYIRLEDRFGNTFQETVNRSKKGDVIDCRIADYEPSAREKSEWGVVLMDITQEECNSLLESNRGISYRKNKLDVDSLNIKKGIERSRKTFNEISPNLKQKTEADISYYKLSTIFNAATRPLRVAYNFYLPSAFAADNISSINKTGQDYDTVALWEDATDNDLVTATTREIAEIYSDDGALSGGWGLGGATTNSTYYRIVRSAAEDRHNGTDNGGATITGQSGGADNWGQWDVQEANAKIQWLIIKPEWTTSRSSSWSGFMLFDKDGIEFSYNVCTPQGISNQDDYSILGSCVSFANNSGGTKNVYIFRNIIYGFDYSTNDWQAIRLRSESARTSIYHVYNNTMSKNDRGILIQSVGTDTMNSKNNLAVNTVTDYSGAADTDNSDYNCSDDATAVGANSLLTCTTSDFVDHTNNNFHIQSASVPHNAGNDLGTSPSGVEIDIDGDTVTGVAAWDMGAHEYDTAAVGTRRVIIVQ